MEKQKSSVNRLTTLWAFNEAVFGGFLHAFHIPFTGLLVGGFAVIIIGLLLYYSNSKKDLLKSAGLVIAIKFLISPYTPFNAYISVFFQTFAGYLLFSIIKSFAVFSYVFSIVTLLFSSLQKIIIYTLLFGDTLWKTIDSFYGFVLNEFGIKKGLLYDTSASLTIIIGYSFLHLLGAFIVADILSVLPDAVKKINLDYLQTTESKYENFPTGKKKKRKFFGKVSIKLILFLSVLLLVLTFVFPEKFTISGNDILIMLVRFFSFLTVWYFLISPFLMKRLEKHSQKTKNKYSDEINVILTEIENLKSVMSFSWNKSKEEPFFMRIKMFVLILISYVLLKDE